MKFYGKAEGIAAGILSAFEAGTVPDALAQVFIKRSDSTPCRAWSWSNQLITCLIGGTDDARGFKQWQTVGRKVRKGTKAFNILGPVLISVDGNGKKSKAKEGGRPLLIGFKSISVFPIENTDVFDADLWAKASKARQDARAWIEDLPLYDVATSWGLTVNSYSGEGARYLGYYKHGATGQAIAVGVENLSTWAHELVHAADNRNDKMVKGTGQESTNEIVAELGGTILLKMLGHDVAADMGGAWQYIQRYSQKDNAKALSACMKLLNRTCEAVNLIIETALECEGAAVA